eukprot:2195084-Ditylum_brightwellii.AAC.1
MLKRTYVFTSNLINPMLAVKVTLLAQNSQTASLDIALNIEKVAKPPQSDFAMIVSQNRASETKFLTDNMEEETFKKEHLHILMLQNSFLLATDKKAFV